MTEFVSLPMYAAPAEAVAAVWRGLRARLVAAGFDDVPDTLSEPDDLDAHWRSPDLLLSQTCGRPLTTTLNGAVALVATPHYDAPGCDGPLYRSLFVVRGDDPASAFADLRGRRAVFNERNSHSGFSQLFAEAAAFDPTGPFFDHCFASGGHLHSMAAVVEGRADVAAVDCVTYALAARDRPETVAPLRVLGASAPAPGLPFVTSARRSAAEIDALFGALCDVVSDPALAPALEGLGLRAMSRLNLDAYAICRERAVDAESLFERMAASGG